MYKKYSIYENLIRKYLCSFTLTGLLTGLLFSLGLIFFYFATEKINHI